MKRISFFLAFVLMMCAFGMANAQYSLSVDQVLVNGSPNTNDTVFLGSSASTVQFNLRFTCADTITGTTCGFRVYTTGSQDFTGTTAGVLPAWPDAAGFSLLHQTPEYSPDGSPDTVSFEFARLFEPGTSGAFDAPAWYVAVTVDGGVTDSTHDGEQLCLDSVTFYGPANLNWVWNDYLGGDILPTWSGEKCLTMFYLPDQPPYITNAPTTISGSHCSALSFDFDSADDDGCTNPNPTYVLVSGPGSIDPSTGVWTYNPTLADVGTAMTIQVAAECPPGNQGPIEDINIVAENDAPAIDNCPGPLNAQVGALRTVDLDATDSCPGDPMNWSVTGTAAGAFSIDANGVLSYTPDLSDAPTQTLTVHVSDGNAESTCDVVFNVFAGAPFGVVIEKDEGQTGMGALQGQYTNVDVTLDAATGPLGGFNLLFAYDNSVLSFAGVDLTGSVLYDSCGWEYMTFRAGADGNCSGGCPSGLVRVVGIAEQNDGPNHPVIGCDVTGLMFGLTFLVSNDRTVECMFAPIRFFWLECGDNTLTNEDGTELYISQTVKDWQGVIPGDPYGPDLGPATGFPTYAGHPAFCIDDSAKVLVVDAIDFKNGGVDIVCAGDIDDRGDINLNGLAYEIGDAVMFTQYFIHGMSALPANTVANPFAREAAIAASDVNNDGLTLTVADLVYLIRVVVGDAVPYPKTTPIAAKYDVSADGQITVEGQMGAAYIVVNEQVSPKLIADNMKMESAFRDGQTHILVYSTEAGQSFEGNFIDLGSNDISYIEMATYDGTPVTSLVGDLVPDNFSLAQNYPNPFNPSTTIEFSLPIRSAYKLDVYNVAGQLVKEFVGTENAGTHQIVWDASSNASGIYFYKVVAGNFTDTKKMVLLK
jgi:hypothetical protein